MLTFLEETISAIKKAHPRLDDLILILPSKRAGGFLKNYLRKSASKTSFSPTIISIEEFIETLSDLKIANPTELLFKSYSAYLKTTQIAEKEDFENYASWANIMLNDFNEIDRYLLDAKAFFTYLSSIKDLNHWYLKEDKTPLIENYLNFWNHLFPLYENIKESLLNEGIGYQGMVYREAAENIEHYKLRHSGKNHIFIGFNALNTAEQRIIQELLETGNTEVYWDIENHFFKDSEHSASHFLRKYESQWKYYQNNKIQNISDNFSEFKNFRLVEASKNIGQVKYLGEILSQYSEEKLDNTAIVLADENMLIPALYSLPKNISKVNITMGVPLKTFPAANFFELLLTFHQQYNKTIYYKDLYSILSHPLCAHLLPESKQILDHIIQQNITHISYDAVQELSATNQKEILSILLGKWENKSQIAIDKCIQLLNLLKSHSEINSIDAVVYYNLFLLFQKIKSLNETYPYIKNLKAASLLYSELINNTTIDFMGDAYNGLQIMGVLETRVLDFENVILLSVNEGVLPAGKSTSSFITYDLKKQFDLPLFAEKDAIYTYHFYHLLHRAKEVTLMYSSFADGLTSGEKSRFVLQLEIENHPNHSIEKVVVSPKVSFQKQKLKTVQKSDKVLERIMEIANKGFSPSSLAAYLRNPMDFYYQKILRINEFQDVEEILAHNTLGTIVHDSLQVIYEPMVGQFLSAEFLLNNKSQIDSIVREQFKKTFKSGQFTKGKNLMIFEVAKRYISNFIDSEISALKNGDRIKILKIEDSLKVELTIDELNFPVFIGGKVDRVDEYNGVMRIVDYKTGMVRQSELEITDWGQISTDNKYSKILQVLAYTLMVDQVSPISTTEAGIISVKNLNSGFLKFGTKTGPKGPKDQVITQKTLSLFKEELKNLIVEICNSEIPFTEKEIL